MTKPTLLILAAGMASRYGSMKQIDGFGPQGETIIDYSIYDAIKAGFGKVVFIIKEEFKDNFQGIFEEKLKGKIEVDYVYQNFDLTKYGIQEEIYREKPWGTGHAVLEAKNKVKEPFCVINADDYYGFDAFEKMANFLTQKATDKNYCLVAYKIGNTLSENGAVSRGVCEANENSHLTSIIERTKVYREDGEIFFEENEAKYSLEEDNPVSMNFWGFTPSVFTLAEKLFVKFAHNNIDKPKAEFYIPKIVDHLIHTGEADIELISTDEKWFGVTFKEDKPIVQENINRLIKEGIYPSKLW